MTSEPFALDSNILVHAVDDRDPLRQSLARRIVAAAGVLDCRLPHHSVAEFYAIATYKLKLDQATAVAAARQWMRLFPGIATSRSAIETAMQMRAANRFSFWDAMLVATAEEDGCRVFISEDMHDGAQLGAIVVRAPFSDGDIAPAVRTLLGLG
jgi:predicted nucleic acid-binding protein